MHPFLFAVLFQGSFALASDPPWRVAEALPSAFSVVAADVNNDQRPDIVIGASAGTVLLLTTADGNFEAGIDLMPGYLARSLAAADFNSDGAIDLVLLFPLSGWIAILKGNGAGAFELAARLPVSSLQSGGLVAADFNRDGVLDLAAGLRVAQGAWGALSVRASLLNVTDRAYAFNFGNPFSGTHFGAPRQMRVDARLRFR